MSDNTEEQHRAIAEFAGVWERGQKCPGCSIGYASFTLPLPEIPHPDHDIPPPPLDDALADRCLDQLQALGEEPQLTGLLKGWRCDSISVVTEELFEFRRDAIYAAVLVYLAGKTT